jgi:hypothetical protein
VTLLTVESKSTMFNLKNIQLIFLVFFLLFQYANIKNTKNYFNIFLNKKILLKYIKNRNYRNIKLSL